MDIDGLNSLKYTVENLTEHRLYSLVTVDVKEAMLQDQMELFLQDDSGFFYDINSESSGDMIDRHDKLFTIYWKYFGEFVFTENHISLYSCSCSCPG